MDKYLSLAIDKMIHTEHMHKSLIDSKVRDIGIHRTQHRILMRLARCGKLPSQKELAERLEVTPAAITIALKKLESNGYVSKTLGRDSRYNEIEITEKGRELVKLTRETFSRTDKSLFSGFTDDELKFYIECLDKIQKNIINSEEKGECVK
jgi:DNA-binding MarR family transcriptional regulator